MKLINRFSPFSPGATGPRPRVLKNRLTVAPMASQTADESGFATARTLAHYRRLASSGAGLVMVEYTYVHRSGRSEPNQLGASCNEQIEGLAQIATAIHEAGALAGLQLTHSGGKTSRDMTGGALMGPSNVPVPVKDGSLEAPLPMTPSEIDLWKESFAAAASRAVSAGFDLVELHSAHGYGLNQWLSPLTNRRSDAYGGDLAGRSRLLFEILAGLRAAHPLLLLAVRMPGQDFLEGGLSVADMQWLALQLQGRGLVDIVDVSSGLGGWRRPRERRGEGYLVGEAAEIQSALRAAEGVAGRAATGPVASALPVIGVGGIQTGAYIDAALARGDFSLAAIGRAVLEDPLAFRRAVLTQTAEVTPSCRQAPALCRPAVPSLSHAAVPLSR